MWCRASGHWYESVREGGRVVSRYRGRGLAAAAMARLEANERLLRARERQQEAERWRRERERLEALDARLDELLAEMQLWAAAAMRLAGWKLHHRGWRRKGAPMGMATAASRHEGLPVPTDQAGITALLKRARQGDETTANAVRAIMMADPERAGCCGGDLALQAEQSLLRVVGKNIAYREAALAGLDLIRKELEGPAPTVLERLLCSRVATCWLQAHMADIKIAQMGNVRLNVGRYHEEQRDRAHRRFLAACRTLAQVRQLALPVLMAQVNLMAGQQQVNVVPPR